MEVPPKLINRLHAIPITIQLAFGAEIVDILSHFLNVKIMFAQMNGLKWCHLEKVNCLQIYSVPDTIWSSGD